MVWYVLNNCSQAEKYVEMFREELEREGASNIEKSLRLGFQTWFRNHEEEEGEARRHHSTVRRRRICRGKGGTALRPASSPHPSSSRPSSSPRPASSPATNGRSPHLGVAGPPEHGASGMTSSVWRRRIYRGRGGDT